MGEEIMKALITLFTTLFLSSVVMATIDDGVPVLGNNYTAVQEEMVRAGAKTSCAIHDEFEDREQCAMDYFAEHNYQGEPDCDE